MSGRLCVRAALLACGLALAPAQIHAQDSAAVRDALRQHRLCPGGTVRVATGEDRVEGRCDGVLDARLLVRSDSTIRVPLAAVDSVWLRRSRSGPGVQVGAIAGGVAGALWGYLAFSTLCDAASGCGSDILVGSLGTAALGSLAGVLVGGAVGSAFRRWVPIHPE